MKAKSYLVGVLAGCFYTFSITVLWPLGNFAGGDGNLYGALAALIIVCFFWLTHSILSEDWDDE